MRRSGLGIMVVIIVASLAACNKVPGYVIKPKQMASVMADIHLAEAVVDMDHRAYSDDSAKLALRQAVFDAHGVTEEKFDTSLVWYGHHMDKYIDMYDMTISELEARSAKVGSMVVASAMSMAGDSVDVWSASRYVELTDRLPSRMVNFDIYSDENWEPGDVYTWRIKLIDSDNSNVNWNIVANYADSTLEHLSNVSTQPGWNEITFVSDSTKQMIRLRGSFDARVGEHPVVWIDSIMLVRKRVAPDLYRYRYQLRKYHQL